MPAWDVFCPQLEIMQCIKKMNTLRRCINVGSLLDRAVTCGQPLCYHKVLEHACAALGPQVVHANPIGSSSLAAICCCVHLPSKGCCSRSLPHKVPYPQELDASEKEKTRLGSTWDCEHPSLFGNSKRGGKSPTMPGQPWNFKFRRTQ